jgi:hypothetical protein
LVYVAEEQPKRRLRDDELDYIATRLVLSINSLRELKLPQGDLATEFSLIVDSVTGRSGVIWRSARDILIVLIKLGGKARFRDFQNDLPYHDSTITRALTTVLQRRGAVTKWEGFWILNSERLPILSWLVSTLARKSE